MGRKGWSKVTLERKDEYVDGKHVKRHDLCEIKLEDIQRKQSKFRGTDLNLSIPLMSSPLRVNEVRYF